MIYIFLKLYIYNGWLIDLVTLGNFVWFEIYIRIYYFYIIVNGGILYMDLYVCMKEIFGKW